MEQTQAGKSVGEVYVVIESFFGRLKDIMSSQLWYRSCDDINKAIDEAIYYLNNIRPIRKLNKEPLAQYRIDPADSRFFCIYKVLTISHRGGFLWCTIPSVW